MSTQANPTQEKKQRGPKRLPFVKQESGILTRIGKVSVSPAGTKKEDRDYRSYTEVKFPSVKIALAHFGGDEKKFLAAASEGANIATQRDIRKANNQETIMTTAKRYADLTGENVEQVFKRLAAAAKAKAAKLEVSS